MQLFPAIDAFSAAFGAGRNQVVWTRLVADLDTPVSLMLKLTEARKDSFLLESVTGGEVRGRYSFMGMKPDLIWECRGARARLNRAARFDADGWGDEPADPLASLRALIAESRIDLPPSCRRWPPASSAISATTWCGWSSGCPTSTPTRSACPTRSCCAPRWCWSSTGSRAR